MERIPFIPKVDFFKYLLREGREDVHSGSWIINVFIRRYVKTNKELERARDGKKHDRANFDHLIDYDLTFCKSPVHHEAPQGNADALCTIPENLWPSPFANVLQATPLACGWEITTDCTWFNCANGRTRDGNQVMWYTNYRPLAPPPSSGIVVPPEVLKGTSDLREQFLVNFLNSLGKLDVTEVESGYVHGDSTGMRWMGPGYGMLHPIGVDHMWGRQSALYSDTPAVALDDIQSLMFTWGTTTSRPPGRFPNKGLVYNGRPYGHPSLSRHKRKKQADKFIDWHERQVNLKAAGRESFFDHVEDIYLIGEHHE